MKLVKLGMVCGALLLAACGGDDGAQGPAGPAGPQGPAGEGNGAGAESINGITPARSFPGRTIRMTISGDNTNWTEAPAVTFDDAAITVANVTVASPTALVLEVEIGENATVGAKTITAGGQAFKGFEVTHSISATLTGSQAQGSLIFLDAINLDPENLFSTSQGGLAPEDLGEGVSLASGGAEAQYASFLILVDANAATGEKPINLQSITGATFTSGTSLNIAARAPEAFGTGVQLAAGESKLFSVTGSGTYGSLYSLALEAPDSFILFELPNGSWEGVDLEMPISGVSGSINATPRTFVLMNVGDAGSATFTASETPLNVQEVEPNNTNATATAIADLSQLVYATFSAQEDVDTFKVTLTEPKVLRARTHGLKQGIYETAFGAVPGAADTIVTLLNSTGDVLIASSDDDFDEDVRTAEAVPAGDYFIRVEHSDFAGGFDASRDDYALQVTLEEPPAP